VTTSTFEAFVVDKPGGTLTLSGTMTCASVTLTSGGFDDGGETLTTPGDFTWNSSGPCTLTVAPAVSGTITLTAGTGALTIEANEAEGYLPATGTTFNAGPFTIQNSTAAVNDTVTLSGTWDLNGGLELKTTSGSGTLTIDNSVNDPSYEIGGPMTLDASGGAITWQKGDGTIRFE
jgi:hypothetical protein